MSPELPSELTPKKVYEWAILAIVLACVGVLFDNKEIANRYWASTLLITAGLCCLHIASVSGSPQSSIFTIRLMWKHQVQFVGFYRAKDIAKKRKFSLLEGGSPIGIDPVAAVVEGINDFGVTTCVDLIRNWHEKWKFREAKIVPCLVIFRVSPVCLIPSQLQKPPITIDDINGAKIAFFGRADSTFREFDLLAKHARIEYTPVFLENEEHLENEKHLLHDGYRHTSYDYRAGYIFNEGYITRTKCKRLSDLFGVSLYSDVLFTKADTIENKSDIVASIIRDIRNGYIYHADVRHEIETWALLEKHCPDFTRTLAETRQGKAALEPIIQDISTSIGNSAAALGEMKTWTDMEHLLFNAGLLYGAFNVDTSYQKIVSDISSQIQKIYAE